MILLSSTLTAACPEWTETNNLFRNAPKAFALITESQLRFDAFVHYYILTVWVHPRWRSEEVQSRTTKARYFAAVGIPIRDMTGTPPEARKWWKTFIYSVLKRLARANHPKTQSQTYHLQTIAIYQIGLNFKAIYPIVPIIPIIQWYNTCIIPCIPNKNFACSTCIIPKIPTIQDTFWATP